MTAKGEIDEIMARFARAFEHPLATAVARGSHREGPAVGVHLDSLVPVTSTEYWRRDAVRFGDRFGVPLRAAVCAHTDVKEAICGS